METRLADLPDLRGPDRDRVIRGWVAVTRWNLANNAPEDLQEVDIDDNTEDSVEDDTMWDSISMMGDPDTSSTSQGVNMPPPPPPSSPSLRTMDQTGPATPSEIGGASVFSLNSQTQLAAEPGASHPVDDAVNTTTAVVTRWMQAMQPVLHG